MCGSIFLIFSQPMECDRIPMDAMAMAIWQLVLVQCICFFDIVIYCEVLPTSAMGLSSGYAWDYVGNHG